MEVILNVCLPNSYFMSPVLTGHSSEWKSHQSGSLEGLQMKELLSLWIYFVVTLTVTQFTQQPPMGTGTAQILSFQTLIRCSWNQKNWSNLSGPCWVSGEKKMLKDRTGLALLPGEWAPSFTIVLISSFTIVLIPCSGLNFPVNSLQTQKLLQIYSRVFAWLNKKYSEKGREIAPFSKWGQKQMNMFLLMDHTRLCLK